VERVGLSLHCWQGRAWREKGLAVATEHGNSRMGGRDLERFVRQGRNIPRMKPRKRGREMPNHKFKPLILLQDSCHGEGDLRDEVMLTYHAQRTRHSSQVRLKGNYPARRRLLCPRPMDLWGRQVRRAGKGFPGHLLEKRKRDPTTTTLYHGNSCTMVHMDWNGGMSVL
jgi:hypothetical protein